MRGRARRIGVVAIGAVGVACMAPSQSQAATFCFPNLAVDASCTAPNTNTNLQTVLAATVGSAGPDTLLIGSGTHPLGTFTGISVVDPANTLQVVGKGQAATALAMTDTAGNKTGFSFDSPAGSTLRDLTLTIPANVDGSDTGILLAGAAAMRNVTVDGPAALSAVGVRAAGSTVVDDSTIDLGVSNSPLNNGVSDFGGSPTITDSEITADIGVRHQVTGQQTTVDRSTIHSSVRGVSAEGGTVAVRNSVIDLEGLDNAIGVIVADLNNGTFPIAGTITGSTIVNGGTDSTGVVAVGDSTGVGENATVTMASTVIDDVDRSLFVGADNGDTATLTTSYSNYNPATAIVDADADDMAPTGTATLTATNQTNLVPGFVDAAGGDFELSDGSPLRDKGDPATPAAGETDRAGNARAISAFSCTGAPARRDIGAFEFDGPFGTPGCVILGPPSSQPPAATPTPSKAKKCAKKKAKKRAGSTAAKSKCKKKKKK